MNNFSLPGGHRRSSFSKQQLHSLIYGKACDIPNLTPKLPAATAYTPMFRHQQGFRLVVPSTGAAVEDHQSQARITCDLQVATDTGLSVARGLDFLKVSLWLSWSSAWFLEHLEEKKRIVQDTEDDTILVFSERGYDWNLHRTGTSKYNFRLSSGDITLLVNKRKADGAVPTCRLEIGSLSCWSPGFYNIYRKAIAMLAAYGATVIKERVSEVHLAADFIGVDIKTLDFDNQEKWVARATDFNPHYKHRRFTGVDLGKGDIMLRCYDKVTELKRSRSAHKQQIFSEIWGSRKFDERPVTRVEYQLRRPKLREFADEEKHKIDTVHDMIESLRSLWNYLTTEWTKHTESAVDRNHHQSRSKASEFWQRVRGVVWTGVFSMVRDHPVKHKDIEMLRKQARGILMSVCACLEVEPDDIDKIVHLCKGLIEEDLHQVFENQAAFVKRMRTKRNEARASLAG